MLRHTRLKSCKKIQIKVMMRYQFLSFIFEMPFSCTSLCFFFLFVSGNSRIFQGDTELQLTPADHVFFFLSEVCFAFRVIYISQLKMNVIKFWISIHVLFQQNSKEHQLNQSLPVFGVSWEIYLMLKLLIDTFIQFSQRKQKTTH